MRSVRETDAELKPSVALTVTENVPAAEGVPEITPCGVIPKPAGRPEAEKVMLDEPPAAYSCWK